MFRYNLELSITFTSEKPLKLTDMLERLGLSEMEVDAIDAKLDPRPLVAQSVSYRSRQLNPWNDENRF
jgi:hypothetical protein